MPEEGRKTNNSVESYSRATTKERERETEGGVEGARQHGKYFDSEDRVRKENEGKIEKKRDRGRERREGRRRESKQSVAPAEDKVAGWTVG